MTKEQRNTYCKIWRQVNREKVRISNKKYRQKNIEKEKLWHKAYCQANFEKLKAQKKAYNNTNKEKIKIQTAMYRQVNPEKMRINHRKQRALRRGLLHKFYENNYIFERDGWLCGICGRKINKRLKYPDPHSPSIDHIIPLSKGGNDSPINVQVAHLRCNMGKYNNNFGQLRLLG